MSVKVKCPNCGLERGVSQDLLGSRARCPNCRSIFRLADGAAMALASGGAMESARLETSPPLETMPMFAEAPAPQVVAAPAATAPPTPAPARPAVRALGCPACGKRFGLPDRALGQVVSCPHCQATLAVGEDGARPVAAGDEGGLDLADEAPAFGAVAGLAPSPPVEAGESEGSGPAEDFVAFLNSRRTARPAPAPDSGGVSLAPTPEGRRTRYGGPAARAATDADVVIRPFFFPEDATVGPLFTERLRDVLAKEPETFGKVVINDSDLAFGRRLTIEDSGSNAFISPPGMFRNGSVRIQAGATLHLPDGGTRTIEGQATQFVQRGLASGMQLKSAVKGAAKTAATKTGNQVLRAVTGAKHLGSEISSYATTSCVLSCLALIPMIGFLFIALGLIAGIAVLVFNGGRERKVGIKRVVTGLVVGGVATLVWSFLFFSANRF